MSTSTTTIAAVQPIDPHSVTSPKGAITNLAVIHDGRAYPDGDPGRGWSCATFDWYGEPAVGLRWDGGYPEQPSGMPQARGYPIWFVVPGPLAPIVVQTVKQLHGETDALVDLRHGINEMMHAARRASPEQMARLQVSLSG